MENILGRKLGLFADLASEDLQALKWLSSARRKTCSGGSDLVSEGDKQVSLYLLLEGWGCRYKHLPDGRRQLLSVYLPGDMCEQDVHLMPAADHSLGAITHATFAEIDPVNVQGIRDRFPSIGRAFAISGMATLSIQREWTLNLGQRNALERMGHFMCEVFFRQQSLGLATGASCPLPLTQTDIADALGITNVHVNRTLQTMRKDGLLDIRGRHLVIQNMDLLIETSMFNPSYLCIDKHINTFVDTAPSMPMRGISR